MKILSRAFEDGDLIPTRYAHQGVAGGKNISLPLEWSNVPQGVKSFAISMVDPHPVARNWVHWLVINISPNEMSIPEGSSGSKMPESAKELYNSFGESGYGGPQPPKGSGPHPYIITLYALNAEKLELGANTGLTAFLKILEGKIIAATEIKGIYER